MQLHSSSCSLHDGTSTDIADAQSSNEADTIPQAKEGYFECEQRCSRPASPECGGSETPELSCLLSEDDPHPSLTIALDNHQPTVPTLSSATSDGKRKLPPWKRAPVPVLPAEFYSRKAIIPVRHLLWLFAILCFMAGCSGVLILWYQAAPSTNPQSVSATTSNSYTEKFKSRAPSANSSSIYSTSSTLSKPRARPPSREVASTAAAVRLGSATRGRAL